MPPAALILVATKGGPTMFERIGVLRALNRHRVPRKIAVERAVAVENHDQWMISRHHPTYENRQHEQTNSAGSSKKKSPCPHFENFSARHLGKYLLLWVGFGFLWGLYGVAKEYAVYFETFPIIHVTGSDTSSPFSLPFSVQNQSTWLPMRGATGVAVS